MKNEYLTWLIYGLPIVLIILVQLYRQKKQRRNTKLLKKNIKAGLNEPASLHPLINNHLCVGCGACVDACPEGNVLGLINGKASLINAAHCIGHGACQVACPFHAISLVFGTQTRGMDIPHVKENFETYGKI